MTRRGAIRAAELGSGVPGYMADFRPVRGRCRGGTKRKPCPSRWGVVRVSLDFRDAHAEVDRLATIECAQCGRTWRRISPPSMHQYQRVHLTIIAPATLTRWYRRGTWHRLGSDGLVVREASMADVSTAAEDHKARRLALASKVAAAKERKADAERKAHEATMDLLARIHDREDAEREAEAEAQAREVAMA